MDRPERKVLWLPAAEIRPYPMQPRRTFEETGLRDGGIHPPPRILQPLTVRRTAAGWELVAGSGGCGQPCWRVWRPSPAWRRRWTDGPPGPAGPVENLQRRDLHYLRRRRPSPPFSSPDGMTQEAVAAQLGMSPRPGQQAAAAAAVPGLPGAAGGKRPDGAPRPVPCCGWRTRSGRPPAARRRQHWNVAQTEQYVERRLAAFQTAPPAGRRTYIIKDVRLFLNSVDRGCG